MKKIIIFFLGLFCANHSAYAMSPTVAAIIEGAAQEVFYRNTGESNWTFNGFLYANDVTDPHLVNGHIFPNGQGLFEIPNVSFAQCMNYTINSWAQMIGLIVANKGPPYGPTQTEGGCTDTSGNQPQDAHQSEMGSCDTPQNGGSNFHYANLNPLERNTISSLPLATCGQCVQGPWWYPCQSGLLGCATPPVPGSCTPFHF